MLKRLNIGKKLIISFILVSLLASIAGVVSIFIMRTIDSRYSEALIDYGFSQGDIGKTMVELANGRAAIYNIIGFTDQSNINIAKNQLNENLEAFNAGLIKVKETLVTDEEITLYNSILSNVQSFEKKREEVIALGDTTDPAMSAKAQQMAVDELDPLYEAVYNDINSLFTLTVSTGTNLSNQLTAMSNTCNIVIVVMVIIAMVVSILLGTFIARGISLPISACAARLRDLAKGDLKSEVPKITAQDETGVLASATASIVNVLTNIIEDESLLLSEMANGNFDIHTSAEADYIGDFAPILASMRKIRTGLSDTLSQINQASDQVASGSEQVAGGAQALSQGATEQASSVQELAATINEISQQVQANATNAVEASRKANQAGDNIEESNQRMQEMISAMADISETSGKIGKIIKTIEDIAFQTNILALNAAVEAARAGAAGKGFAVVADEVRSLASKSGEAAKNTTELISSSIKAVENGTYIVDETAASMSVVVTIAQEVAQIVDKISEASRSQAESIAQVTTGVDQISAVVQTNSATAEESAAASEELSSQARLLKELVARFKLAQEFQRNTGLALGANSFTNAPTAIGNGSFSSADAY